MDNKQFVFVIDCDEVIRPLIRNMVDVYNERFNQHLTYEDITNIDCDVSFPLLAPYAADWFFQENGRNVYLMRPPIDGAIDALKKLRKYGKVIIATYQSSVKNKIWTTKWFEKHGIVYDDLFFGKDKKYIQCDFFIDDDPKYFIGTNAKYGIFMTSAHNKTENLQGLKARTNCKSIVRFNSLRQFADYFENYINNN